MAYEKSPQFCLTISLKQESFMYYEFSDCKEGLQIGVEPFFLSNFNDWLKDSDKHS